MGNGSPILESLVQNLNTVELLFATNLIISDLNVFLIHKGWMKGGSLPLHYSTVDLFPIFLKYLFMPCYSWSYNYYIYCVIITGGITCYKMKGIEGSEKSSSRSTPANLSQSVIKLPPIVIPTNSS